jgi:hypothetical protein
MPILKMKLLEADSAPELQTKINALVAADSIVNGLRGMALSAYRAADLDTQMVACLAYAGTDLPAGAGKTSNVKVLSVEGNTLAKAQAALDLALSEVLQATNATGNANTNPGDINVTGNMFLAGDVGRKIRIGGALRTITAFTSTTRVTYSGAAIAGTGLTVELLGAEVLQPDGICVSAFKDQNGGSRIALLVAVSGEQL